MIMADGYHGGLIEDWCMHPLQASFCYDWYIWYVQDSDSGPDVGQLTKQLKAVNDYFQGWDL